MIDKTLKSFHKYLTVEMDESLNPNSIQVKLYTIKADKQQLHHTAASAFANHRGVCKL